MVHMTARNVATHRSSSGRPSGRRVARTLVAGAFSLLAFVSARTARAQEVSGRVQAVGTSEPIAGAQITVPGGAQRATSDQQGRFRLTGLTGTTVTIEVRRIGYRSDRFTARVGQTDLVVSLTAAPTSLEALVVTGQP